MLGEQPYYFTPVKHGNNALQFTVKREIRDIAIAITFNNYAHAYSAATWVWLNYLSCLFEGYVAKEIGYGTELWYG